MSQVKCQKTEQLDELILMVVFSPYSEFSRLCHVNKEVEVDLFLEWSEQKVAIVVSW